MFLSFLSVPSGESSFVGDFIINSKPKLNSNHFPYQFLQRLNKLSISNYFRIIYLSIWVFWIYIDCLIVMIIVFVRSANSDYIHTDFMVVGPRFDLARVMAAQVAFFLWYNCASVDFSECLSLIWCC